MRKYYNTHHLAMFNKEQYDTTSYDFKKVMDVETAARLGVVWVGGLTPRLLDVVDIMWTSVGVILPAEAYHVYFCGEPSVPVPCIGAEKTLQILEEAGFMTREMHNGNDHNVLIIPPECGGLWWSGKRRNEEGGVSYDGPGLAMKVNKWIW